MLRRLLVRASDHAGLGNFVTTNELARQQARRFVAGETATEGLAAAQDLNDRGFWVSLDHVGEEVGDATAAVAAADHYVQVLERIQDTGAGRAFETRIGVSVKPTQVGMRVDLGLCREQVARIAMASAGAHVTLDMEDHTTTDATIGLVEDMHAAGHTHVGCAVQSALHRTVEDVARLVELGASLRLCKGAYAEPEAQALQDASAIRNRYIELADVMLGGNALPRFATHDHVLVDAIRGRLRLTGSRPADEVEFQMLYGVRVPLQQELLSAGLRTLVYLPYGDQWFPYFMRRLAERPANLLFFLRALTERG